MATKLKLLLQNPTLKLAFKSVFFALLLNLVGLWDFGLIPVLLFLVVVLFLYAKPLFRTFETLTPFIILVVLSLVVGWLLYKSPYFVFASIFFSSLFYIILGVKDLALIQRAAWYRFVNLSLAYTALLVFFYANQEYFLGKILLLFLVLFLLLKNLIKKRLTYWLIAFLILEAAWAVSLLPIGFISSANLVILLYFILTDLALLYIGGELTRKRILIDVTIFIVLLLAVLTLSRWGI